MKKLTMKPIGGCINPGINDPVCSSAFNTSKYIQWLPFNYSGEADIEMYIDNGIIEGLKNSKQKYGWLLESKQYNLDIIHQICTNLDFFKQHYKYIFTCQMDLVNLGAPFAYTISNAAAWTQKENRKKPNKTGLISMLTSNNSSLPGHKYRIDYMNKNKQYLDTFGRGHNEIQFTDEAFLNYMFTVSMENDTSDAYFTERLTSPMTTYTVPIYRGSKAVVEQYFNPKGVLWENEIELKDLNEDLYNSMLPYIEENYKLACDFPVADDYIIKNYFI